MSSKIKAISISRGTLVVTDLIATKRFYEDFFGFECSKISGGRMFVRDGFISSLLARGDNPPHWVLDVRQVQAIQAPQGMLNHWGTFVATPDAVDAGYRAALESREKYGLKKIMKPREQHWAYSFYLEDSDSNWWEIEYRGPRASYAAVKERGDVYSPGESAQ